MLLELLLVLSVGFLQTDDFSVEIGDRYTVRIDGSDRYYSCLLYTSPSPRDLSTSRMPSSA